MAHPWHHAVSSTRRWGGEPSEYLAIHSWFDLPSKGVTADPRHRALRHHTLGIMESEQVFGATITLSTGRVIPVRWVGEQHVFEDLGRVPSFQDWLEAMAVRPWMNRSRRLSRELDQEVAA